MKKEDRYDSLIRYYAGQKGLNWKLLKAQIKAESNFNPNARSPVGALGLPQFMKATWLEWQDGTPGIQSFKNLFKRTNPEAAIRSQAAYMKWLFKRFSHLSEMMQQTAVLASYNWGVTRVRRLIKKYGWMNFDALPEETRNYVNKIDTYFFNQQ